jgi:hypothetical protein
MPRIPAPFVEPPHVYCDPIDDRIDRIATGALLAALLGLAFCAGLCATCYLF